MSRFVYKEESVNSSINMLQDAYKTLDQTEAELNSGFNHLEQVQGGSYIDVAQSRKTICGFPETARNYINELRNAIESKSAEIKDYNSAPWYKKLFATIGMSLAKFGEGFINAFENLADACISVVGFTSGIFGIQGVQDWCKKAIEFDVAGTIVSNVYKEGTYIGKYSIFGPNSTAANVIKGFGTAAGYMVIGKIGGKLAGSANKLLGKVNLNIGETGVNSIAAAVGGLGSGTESALLEGKSFNEAFFQGTKVGMIQGTAAYVIGKFGDQYAKENAKYLVKERKELMLEKSKLMKDESISESARQTRIAQIDKRLVKVDKKLANFADKLEEVGQKDMNHANDMPTQQIDSIDNNGILTDEKIQKINNKHKFESTKSGDQGSIIAQEQIENSPELKEVIKKMDIENTKVSASKLNTDVAEDALTNTSKGGSAAAATSTGGLNIANVESEFGKNLINESSKGYTVKNIYQGIKQGVSNYVTNNTGSAMQFTGMTAMASQNQIVNSEAKVANETLRAAQNSTPVSVIPVQNGTNGGYGNSTSKNYYSGSSNNTIKVNNTTNNNLYEYTGHVVETAKPKTGEELQKAISKSQTKTTPSTSNSSNNNTANTSSQQTELTQTGGGRSFITQTTSSTPTSSTSGLATSIGTIKATNTKTATTAATSTAATAATIKEAAEVATAVAQSPMSPYQSPTSTQVIAGGSKYPVNRPQIEGSLAQNNVSTTTLGSSGSTHGGGGYSNSGFSLSGSSAVTSDGSIGEQDTKGTLASSITKNNSSKTETIRLSENEEEIDEEQKANNFVIPTSAALSAAAAAGIGAKIVMDKRDKDKEEEKEQEESDDDFEVISSDFENDFESDYDDKDNEYEVVESY